MTKTPSRIHFSAQIHRPAEVSDGEAWTFLNLPDEASEQLPSRSMVTVEGTFDRLPFQATLVPDGMGGHWLKVSEKLREAAGAKVGGLASLDIAPTAVEPEPEVPSDIQMAIERAPAKARETWLATTPLARRDWIFWIVSGRKAETRSKRIEVAISKLSAGSRRPCCFDRSGMASKSLACPIAAED